MEPSSGYSTLLRNLRYSTTPQVVREAFERFGKIRDVYLPLDFNTKRPRGFGFVEYYEKSDALDAVKAMDNTELDGSVISCCIAQDRRKSPSSMRRVYRNRERRGYRSRSYSYPGRRSRTPPRMRDDRHMRYSRERSPRRFYRDRRDPRDNRGYRDRYDNYDRDGGRFREPYDRDREFRDRPRDRNFRNDYKYDRDRRDDRDHPHDRRENFRDDREDFRDDRDYRDGRDDFDGRDGLPRYGDHGDVEVDMDKDKDKLESDNFGDYSRSPSASNH